MARRGYEKPAFNSTSIRCHFSPLYMYMYMVYMVYKVDLGTWYMSTVNGQAVLDRHALTNILINVLFTALKKQMHTIYALDEGLLVVLLDGVMF